LTGGASVWARGCMKGGLGGDAAGTDGACGWIEVEGADGALEWELGVHAWDGACDGWQDWDWAEGALEGVT